VVVPYGVVVLDRAAALDQTSLEEHGSGQGGLAASVGSEQHDFLVCLASKVFMMGQRFGGAWVTCHRGGPAPVDVDQDRDARRMG
jgi:hypothetical protein